ncbi:MAG TPA: hypothetical protein VLQ92_10210 [Candidatus Limnocylindrales bacterium]|nr:hypothetical protein [Candidatus Limnocylindrales bacterium]
MSNKADSTQAAPSEAAAGLTVFAAVMMMMIGAFQVIQGIIALANDTFYVVGAEYVFQFDVTTWGWIHLLLGALVAVAGHFVLQAKVWARTVGVIVAVVSALFNFAWLPYYPVWSILIIALNVFVIWALTVRGRDVTRI